MLDPRLGDANTEVTDPEPVVPPIPTLESASPQTAVDHRWHVGTLAYTAGGLVVLFCWLLWGDFAWSLKERSIAQVVQLLLKHFDSPDWFAGLLLGTLPNVLSVLIGPVISYKSDRYRSRWGRRIPFLLVTTPVAALSIVGMAFSPMIGQAFHRVLGNAFGLNPTILLFFGLFWTTFEFGTITANSIFGAFVNDVVPRPLLGRFYGLFRALSLIAGILFGHYLMGRAEAHFIPIFLGVGAVYAVGFLSMCLKVKEGQYPEPMTTRPAHIAPLQNGATSRLSRFDVVAEYFRDCFGNPYYRWVFLAITVSSLAFLPINLFNIFFAKSVKMDMYRYGNLIALSYVFSLVQAFPVGWLADRFHPLRVSMVAVVLHAGGAIYGGLYGTNPRSFGVAFVVCVVFSGTYWTATAAIGQVLLPRAKFAQYASALQITLSVGSMILSPLLGVMLDLLHHQYRYTYLLSFGLDGIGLILLMILFQKFRAYGGPNNYVAPE